MDTRKSIYNDPNEVVNDDTWTVVEKEWLEIAIKIRNAHELTVEASAVAWFLLTEDAADADRPSEDRIFSVMQRFGMSRADAVHCILQAGHLLLEDDKGVSE